MEIAFEAVFGLLVVGTAWFAITDSLKLSRANCESRAASISYNNCDLDIVSEASDRYDKMLQAQSNAKRHRLNAYIAWITLFALLAVPLVAWALVKFKVFA